MGEVQAHKILDAFVEGDNGAHRDHQHQPGRPRSVEVDILVSALSPLIAALHKKGWLEQTQIGVNLVFSNNKTGGGGGVLCQNNIKQGWSFLLYDPVEEYYSLNN